MQSADASIQKGSLGRLPQGIILAFEGIDASGKNTQSRLLYDKLLKNNLDVEYLSFPDYRTNVGSEIRSFLSGKKDYSKEAKHILYAANRYEHKNEIEAWLSKKKVIVVNRYCDSNLAYGVASELPLHWLRSLESLMPPADYVFLVKITPEISNERKPKRDKFELDLDFLRHVSLVYEALADNTSWFSIDGTKSVDDIHFEISKLAESLIRQQWDEGGK